MSSPDSQNGYLIGVDGGATKTAVLLADGSGTILGRGVAPASNYQKIGLEAACAVIELGLADAFDDAGLPAADPAAICLGLAGIDRAEDQERFEAWLRRRMPQSRYLVINDAELPLAAGTPAGWGVGVICGTGATSVGRAPDGRMARADGWGYLLGDDGSGFSIGQAALRAVLRAHDGRGPATALTAAVLAHWSLQTPDDLVERVYLEQAGPADIAALARVVNGCAEEGDAVARRILHAAGSELAVSIEAVVRRLGMDGGPVPCGLAGGVVTRSRFVSEATQQSAAARGLVLDPYTLVPEPVEGALRLAQRLLAGPEGDA